MDPRSALEAISKGKGRGIRIAVLDSGVETSHPDLAGMPLADDLAIVERGLQLRAEPGEGIDLFGHGTAVAGLIHAIAPEAEIGSIRVLGASLSARTAIILEGARIAIARGYHLLNCSFGCGQPEHVLKYKAWVDEAYLRGVHVVAACNNQDSQRPEWPGFFSSVLTANMARSHRGDGIFYRPGSLVEFAASGVDVEVLWRDKGRKVMTGSSFAAPRLSGIVANLLSVYPDLRPLEVKTLLHHVAQPWTADL